MTAPRSEPRAVPRWAPWAHAVCAGAVGAVLGQQMQSGVIGVLLGGGALALPLLAVAGLAFGLLGALFLRRARGWWLAATVLLWAPAAAVSTFAGAAANHGELDFRSWVPPVICGGVAGLVALLAHRGPARWIGAALTAGTLVALIAAGTSSARHAEIVEAQQSLGSSLRPEVLVLPRYRQRGDPVRAGADDALLGAFMRGNGEDLGTRAYDLAVVTARGRTAVCGPQLLQVGPEGGSEAQTSCRRTGDGWVRTSAHGIERVRHADGKLVRVLAPSGTSESVLDRALRSLRPMDDRYYRHLLLGERGSYIPELDGLR